MKNTTPSGTRTLSNSQAVGPNGRLDHLADRIGERGDLFQRRGHRFDRASASAAADRSRRRSGRKPGAAARSRAFGCPMIRRRSAKQRGRCDAAKRFFAARVRVVASSADAALRPRARRPSSSRARSVGRSATAIGSQLPAKRRRAWSRSIVIDKGRGRQRRSTLACAGTAKPGFSTLV